MEGTVTLREIEDTDLDTLFENEQDADALHMAAFTRKNPADRAAFDAHWERIRAAESIPIRAILCDGRLAGSVLSFEQEGQREVSYWIGRPFWGRGIATRGLALFLEEHAARPVFARVATDNAGSIRVLEKCGFAVCGKDRYFANARGEEIEELILELR